SSRLAQHEAEIDLGIYWTAITEKKWFIVFIVFLAMGIAGFYIIITIPVYKTNTILQLEIRNSPLKGLDDISSMLSSDNQETLAEIEIIRSRHVIGQVVKKLRLDTIIEPRYFPIIGEGFTRYYKKYFADDNDNQLMEPLWGLSQFAWGGEKIKIDHLTVSTSYENQTLKLIAGKNNHYQLYDVEGNLLLEGYVGKLVIAKLEEEILVEVKLVELQARPGTEFIIIKESHSVTVSKLQEKLEVTEKSRDSGILELNLEGYKPVKIKQILNTIAQIYVQQNIERKSQEIGNMLSFVNKQLPILKTSLKKAEARLRVYYKKYGTVNVELETHTLLNQLAEVEKRISSLELALVNYKSQYSKTNPILVILKKQLTQLKSERTAFNKRIRRLPKAEMDLVEVMRDVEVTSEVYALLLNKAQELEITKAGVIGTVYIVDPAIIAIEPIKPNQLLIIGMAVFSGLFLGIFLALLRKAIHDSIDSVDIIEQRLNLDVYAIVPHSAKQTKITKKCRKKFIEPQILAIQNPNELAVESLRSLRTNLQFTLMKTKKPIITINGSVPGVGKSFISSNLAQIIANNTSKRVLLIDGDMRKAHLHQCFGQTLSPGLSEIISGKCELEMAIRHISSNIDDKEIEIS
ncbi:MAG: hypothetical protein KAI79_10370, partial [Bacteroidales bacterium]|nr:hypothetical protein [Bacteroidales bacterium]